MKRKLFAPAIFKENLKRFWSIAFVGFIICYLSGPINIVQKHGYLYTGNVEMILKNFNFGYAFYSAAVPCIAALAVFSYLHKNSSVLAVHSMPYTRKSLFVSNYLSGLIISVIPVLATALLLAVFKQPTCGGVNEAGQEIWQYNVYTFKAIGLWLAMLLIVIVFIYSLCVLAAMLTGNVVLQLLTSAGLNLIVPAMYFIFACYADNFLDGYNTGMDLKVFEYLHPAFWLAEGAAGFLAADKALLWTLLFIAIALIISFVSYKVYEIRQLERTGDSYVFAPVKWTILVVLVFFGTSAGGLGFSYDFGFMAYVIGFVITFVVAMMILSGSFRFSLKKSIIPAAVCIASVVIAIAGFSFDILGLEKYVPNASKVASIDFYGAETNRMNTLEITDRDEIALIIEIHKKLIAESGVRSDDMTYVDINYKMNNGHSIGRSYMLPTEYLRNMEELNRLYTDYLLDDIRTMFDGVNPARAFGELALTNPGTDMYISIDIAELTTKQKADLLDAIVQDYAKDSYTKYVEAASQPELGSVYLYGIKSPRWDGNFAIRESYPNLLKIAEEYIDEYYRPGYEPGYEKY